MKIRFANIADKENVLAIADEFNDYSNSLDEDWDGVLSTFAKDNAGKLFEELVTSPKSKIVIAEDKKKLIGILEIHKVPRLRKANYYAEIELMFVTKAYHGKGVAQLLMRQAIKWAETERLTYIRLYTGHVLKRAHAFYEKMGFTHAGRTYKYDKLKK